jgi:hypothetical protein
MNWRGRGRGHLGWRLFYYYYYYYSLHDCILENSVVASVVKMLR